MTHITLNADKISQLIKNKSIEVPDYNFIEISDDNLQLNCDGCIYSLTKASFEFSECPQIHFNFIVEDIQKIVCRHFNLEPRQVIYTAGEDYDFIIRFANGNETKIVVIDYDSAVKNTNDISDEPVTFPINAPRIGLYKKLGNANYYFRWVEDI